MYDKKVHGKRYNIAHKLAAAALATSGSMSVTQAAREAGVSRMAIYRVKHDEEIRNLHAQEVSDVKDALSKLTYKRSFDSLKAITPEKLQAASALQLMTVAAIGIEKGRLMEGLSTENISHRSVIEHINNEVSKLDEQLNDNET